MRLISSLVPLAASYCCWLTGVDAFTNPIKTGSDPQMVYHDGMYYLTSTTWTDVQITAASTIEGLKTATAKVIWSDTSNPNRACNFWAPEMHKLDGRWHLFFSASVCNPDWGVVLPTLRVYTLAGGAENPLSADYELLGPITPPNFTDGMLDATIFDINNTTYFIYSSVHGPQSPAGASLWIAELLSPTTCSNATMIAAPEFDWEKSDSAVLEGPYGLVSPSGTSYIVYSADSCNTPANKLGALRYDPSSGGGGDPMSPSSWGKLPDPIFATGNGLYGPAHNAFFKSPDGTQDWQVFHANLNERDGCGTTRKTFIQPISWRDDAPDLGEPLPVGTEIAPPS
uniref:Glycosyl hydrolase family 43 protein n=1 Tax=Pyricularia oryzae (strain 70-15 / ATCC MYA-4617 / FGSC 8958) TaxID=242507 RepID=Q2KET6_PYRO7|nr:hypothetical protein MGCH7_ch7g950 [Pyricularia oryzae 70-15]